MNEKRQDPLTIAYIALGAEAAQRKALAECPSLSLDQYCGHIGYIDRVLESAPLVDAVGDWLSEHDAHRGTFLYDVAETFGEDMGGILLDFPRQYPGSKVPEDAEGVLRHILWSLDYEPELIDRMFADFKAEGRV